jgi:predicted GNAT superfamily acetyltransferase
MGKPPSRFRADTEAQLVLRQLAAPEDFEACVALQKETWGASFSECVPPSLLMISQKVGGVAAGAFDADGSLVGFVFGLTGIQEGRRVHWSHMLAVRPEARDRGLGTRLKKLQRDLLRPLGVEAIYWTYDPLVARNAHLNLNRLGVEIRDYVPQMYGEDFNDELNRGIGTDRFVVSWDLEDQEAEKVPAEAGAEALAGQVQEGVVVNTRLDEAGQPAPVDPVCEELSMPLVEIPEDIQQVKAAAAELGLRWRVSTRQAFLWYLERGYRVAGFFRQPGTGRFFYCLARSGAESLNAAS